MGKVYAITSGKGGTGKTMFAVNMGAMLAMDGHKVVLLDMDMGLRNIDLYLGLENKVVYNLMDVLSGLCRIRQALIKDRRFGDRLYLISASPGRDTRDITPMHMQVLCDKLKKKFDYIIIDAPAGLGDGLTLSVAAADSAVIITEAEAASVRDADTVDRELQKMGIRERICIVNKVHGDLVTIGAMPGLSTVSRGMRLQIEGVIQYDDNIYLSCNKGVPIVMKKGTYIEKNFRKILKRILAAGSQRQNDINKHE
ncbi:MAG: septum site-determining protein MinD [Eubacteriales bacterium]|jgi:septum site-determining protein MinD|nr:septum site-determining protein MinD [Eubacteriales bacterium]